MPPKVLPQPEDFKFLERTFLDWGLRPIEGIQLRPDFRRLSLQAPWPREGREAGFEFSANGLTVRVWTTWLRQEMMARDKDEAWVLIIEGDKVHYYSHPIRRTGGFTRNLPAHAWIALQRVIRRPRCQVCGEFMAIVSGHGVKSRFWRCDRRNRHPDRQYVFIGWDDPLSPEDQLLVRAVRRKRQNYEQKRKKEGKPLHVALKKRRSWQQLAS